MLQNSDESNNVVLIETSESEFDDEEDKDSWKAMQENEYKLDKVGFFTTILLPTIKQFWC